MINWIKNLFKDNKNISEPVLTIVNSINTKRDLWKIEEELTERPRYTWIVVEDRTTKLKFRVLRDNLNFNGSNDGEVVDLDWLTQEEKEYLGGIIYQIYLSDREEKWKAVEEEKRLSGLLEREKWKEIYCK